MVLRSADVAVNSLVIAADWPTSVPFSMPEADALHEAALHDVEHVRLGDELACDRVVGGAAGRDDLHAAGVERAVGALGEVVATAHVGRAAADRVALVREQRQRDGPAVVHLADDGVGREPHVVEELLAELERPVDLLDRVDLHARPGGSP